MRAAAAFAAILLLSGCTWVRGQLEPIPTVEPSPKPEPAPKPPRKIAKPVPAPEPQIAPAAVSTPDYTARCREMADNRARDAKELGVNPADQQKVHDDAYNSCMARPTN
jgi:hypothetical protein